MIAFIELYPFYWIVITAFKTNLQFQQFRSVFWPDPWTLEHFRWVLTRSPWLTWLRNTVIVALVRHGDQPGRLRPGGLRPGAPALAGGRLRLHRRS